MRIINYNINDNFFFQVNEFVGFISVIEKVKRFDVASPLDGLTLFDFYSLDENRIPSKKAKRQQILNSSAVEFNLFADEREYVNDYFCFSKLDGFTQIGFFRADIEKLKKAYKFRVLNKQNKKRILNSLFDTLNNSLYQYLNGSNYKISFFSYAADYFKDFDSLRSMQDFFDVAKTDKLTLRGTSIAYNEKDYKNQTCIAYNEIAKKKGLNIVF